VIIFINSLIARWVWFFYIFLYHRAYISIFWVIKN